MDDAKFVRWVHERLLLLHHEDPLQDWMQRLDRLALVLEGVVYDQREQARKAGWWDDLCEVHRQKRMDKRHEQRSSNAQARKEELMP